MRAEAPITAVEPRRHARRRDEADDAEERPQDLAHLEQVPAQRLEGRQDQDPQEVGEALEAVAGVEDQALAGHEVVRVAKRDVRVVLDELEHDQDPGNEGDDRHGEQKPAEPDRRTGLRAALGSWASGGEAPRVDRGSEDGRGGDSAEPRLPRAPVDRALSRAKGDAGTSREQRRQERHRRGGRHEPLPPGSPLRCTRLGSRRLGRLHLRRLHLGRGRLRRRRSRLLCAATSLLRIARLLTHGWAEGT